MADPIAGFSNSPGVPPVTGLPVSPRSGLQAAFPGPSGRLPPSQRQGLGSYIFALVCPSPPPHTLGGGLGRWLVLSGPSGGHQAMVCEHLAPSPAPHPAPSLSPTWASHPGPASSFFFFCGCTRGMQDLSSSTRDQTHALCSESTES